MKFASVTTALLASTAGAFAPNHHSPTRTTSLETTTTRSEFFIQLAGVVAATGAFPGVASAAKYGSFGAGSSGVLDPKEALIDDAIFDSIPVQQALKNVKDYGALVREMKATLQANSQVNLGPVLKKEFDFGKLRAELNTLNSAFDEDTQRGTDRLIRGILQDLTELEVSNGQKDGIERSPRRLANMLAKLDKLQGAFDELLKFAKV